MTGRVRLTAQAAFATIAASTALGAVFHGTGWFVPVAGAVVLVAVVNELMRRTPFAGALGPLISAGAVLCYVTAGYASDAAYARFIPTGASLQVLADHAHDGFNDVRTLTTPVPTHAGLVLLAIVGIAAIELIVDLLAVTLRRAALAGLPLLAVFALCTSIAKGGAGWLPFTVAAIGYLWLLLVDSRERIGRWGRTFGANRTSGNVTWADADVATSPLAALSRRIGATAIAVGVIAPVLIPGLHGGLPKSGTGGFGGHGKGSNQVVTVNPLVTIRGDLVSSKPTKVLTMRSSDPLPAYLRLTALDNFDGLTFFPNTLQQPASARVSKGIPFSADVTGPTVRTDLRVTKLAVHWLPVPTVVSDVNVSGDWRFDPATATIFSARDDTKDLHYTVLSTRFEPSALDLGAAPSVERGQFAADLALPAKLPIELHEIAELVTKGAATPFDKAIAIQNYLSRPPFVYSTDVTTGDTMQALVDFLKTTHRGFCQQYAASMAVLARLVGIPARVAVGFTRGQRQADGSWVVTTHDAHAWPELFFPGYGWLPFEPTPRSDGQTVTPPFTLKTPTQSPSTSTTTTPTAKPTPGSDLRGEARKQQLADNGGGVLPPPETPVTTTHHSSRPWWPLPLVLLVAAVVPAVVRMVTRRRRLATSDPRVAWAELRASAIDAGVEWLDGVTPRGAARVVLAGAPVSPPAREALDRLVHREERARYARNAAVVATSDDLRRDVVAVAHALRSAQPPWQRAVATVWPRSTLRSMRERLAWVADVLDFIDDSGARLRRWMQRRRLRPAG